MKNQLLLLVMTCILSFSLQAQIVLNQSNTSFNPGVVVSVEANLTGFTLPAIGINQLWNYSYLTMNSASTWTTLAPSNTNYPTATYEDTTLSTIFIPNYTYYCDAYFQTSSTAANCLGYVVNEQRYPVTLAGNPLDSCIFPEQFLVLNSPSYSMTFPATMSSSWHANYRSYVNFILTVNAYSIHQVPCQKVSHINRLDTVIGWGKMRVPTLSGPSLAYDVLLVKRINVQTDSFYMAGSPAQTALLSGFGVSQGQTTTSNRYLFWRENGRYPLMMVNFGSNNFTVPSNVFFDGTATYDPNAGIDENHQNSELIVYPNPASEKLFIESNNKFTEYTIYNSIGEQVSSGKIVNNVININELPKGLYIAQFINAFQTTTVKFMKE